MSDSNKSFPPAFFFSNSSTSSSSSPGNNGGLFSFSAGETTTKLRRKFKTLKSAETTAERSKTTTPPSSFAFECPRCFGEEENEKKKSKQTTHENGMPENNAKTRFDVLSASALTKMITCSFEGSSYSSHPSEPNCFDSGTEEFEKKETDGKSVQNSFSSHIIVSQLLKGIPQSPHFWPLRSYSTAAKLSLINAWNQIFEDTVDQIQNVKLTGFGVESKRLWETTQDLQMMGYNVLPLRRRLVELSDVMLQKKKHGSDKMRLKSKAEQHLMEKNKLDFEILKLKLKAEAEKASFEDVMANLAKMDDEMPRLNGLFSKLAIKPL